METKDTAFPFFSILIATCNRPEELKRCLNSINIQSFTDFELIILDDGSFDEKLLKNITQNIFPDALFLRNNQPTGIAASRNKLFSNATGNWLFTLDDDAWLPSKNTLKELADSLALLPETHGIVALKIKDNALSNNTKYLCPFPKKSLKKNPELLDQAQLVSYYLGGAHVIKKDLLLKIGTYDETFYYGQEEQDLSYKALDAGFLISYLPAPEIYHQAQNLRHAQNRKKYLLYLVKSRFFLTKKYLPIWAIPSYLLLWTIKYLLLSIQEKNFSNFAKGLWAGLTVFISTKRQPLNTKTIQYLANHYGRIWY